MSRPRAAGWLVGASLAIGTLAYAATGLVAVRPGEVVVARRLGRVLPTPLVPGLHWSWPIGLERRDRVRPGEVRQVTIGADVETGPEAAGAPGRGEYLTGDRGLVRIRAVVQFRVADPVAFLTCSPDPDSVLLRAAEGAASLALSHAGIDEVLGPARVVVARRIETMIGERLNRAGLGVALLGVRLIEAMPPWEVRAAFDAAQQARGARQRRMNEARAKATATAAAAEAEALAMRRGAEAQAVEIVASARAQAGRFLALLEQARLDRAGTVRHLYVEALRKLLPKVRRKLVVAGGRPIEVNLPGGR